MAFVAPAPAPPWAVVVMGVSGVGKSAVAAGIAQGLHLECIDGDDLHAEASVAKMRAGIALADDDRWPWLDRIGLRLRCGPGPEGNGGARAGVVVSCSALRRAYRDRLRLHVPGLRFLFLNGSAELIRARLQQRSGHYMPASLLDSQLRTLEVPQPDDEPDVLALGVEPPVADVVARAVALLRASALAGSTP